MFAIQKNPRDVPLDACHKHAKASVLALLRGDDPLIGVARDLDTLAARNRELIGGGPEAIREALGDQLTLLEAGLIRFMRDAAVKGLPDHRRAFAAVALRCQGAFVQTCLAMNKLDQDHADSKAIVGNAVRSAD